MFVWVYIKCLETNKEIKNIMKNRILVVGGAGYIGGAVTDELIKREINFSVFDNLTYEHHYLKAVDFIYGDIRDRKKLSEVLKDYSTVIWLAALVGDPACAINPALTKQINQDSVQWLAENFSGRILFTSTCSVYGASNDPVDEKSATNPLSVYAATKLAAEGHLAKSNALIFRLGTAFGVSDTYSRIRMDLAVNYMTMNAIKNGYLEVFGGVQWRPFIHVRDIARFLVDNIESDKRGIFNLATENIQISELARRISQRTKCKVRTTEQKFQDNRNYNANVSKAKKAGILPKKTNNDILFGVDQIKNLIVERRINDPEYELYSNVKRLNSVIENYLNIKTN